MRMSPGTGMFLLILFTGCVRDRQSVAVTGAIDDSTAMKSAVFENIPKGTTVVVAREFMEREGFECSVRRNGSFADHENIDYLYCDRYDQIDMLVSRRWQIAVLLEDDAVADVAVSDGFIGL